MKNTSKSLLETSVPGIKIREDLYELHKESLFSEESLKLIKEVHSRFRHRIVELRYFRLKKQMEVNRKISSGKEPFVFPYLDENLSPAEREESRLIHKAFDELQFNKLEVPAFAKREQETVLVSPMNLVSKGLSSLGAKVKHMLADFEDAELGVLQATLMGIEILKQYTNGVINYTDSWGRHHSWKRDVHHRMNVAVRVNGFGLSAAPELLVDAAPAEHILVELALNHYFNAKKQNDLGLGPSYYLPKIRHAQGARLFKDIIDFLDEKMGLMKGTSKVILMNEELSLSFEQREALFELSVPAEQRKECLSALKRNQKIKLSASNLVGVNCGYWDYNASVVEQLSEDPDRNFPSVSRMNEHKEHVLAMQKLMIYNCKALGIHPEGGMYVGLYQAQEIFGREEFNRSVDEKIQDVKFQEAALGMDSTWIALPLAYKAAQRGISQRKKRLTEDEILGSNPYNKARDLMRELLNTPKMKDCCISFDELIDTLRVPLEYGESWAGRGVGCSPISEQRLCPQENYTQLIIPRLMEDVATSRRNLNLLLYWALHKVDVQVGPLRQSMSFELVNKALKIVLKNIKSCMDHKIYAKKSFPFSAKRYEQGYYESTAGVLLSMFRNPQVIPFYTTALKKLYFELEDLREQEIKKAA